MMDFPCVKMANLFFVDERDPEDDLTPAQRRLLVDRAKALCDLCSKKDKCLALAMADRTRRGIYGGTTTQERLCLQGACRHAGHRQAVAA